MFLPAYTPAGAPTFVTAKSANPAPETLVETVAALSIGFVSKVSDDTEDDAVMTEPAAVPLFTFKTT